MVVFDYVKWYASLPEDTEKYSSAQPFPHIVFRSFLEVQAAEKTLEVFPEVHNKGWIHYIHINEKKHGLNRLELLPAFIRNEIIRELNSKEFIAYLEKLTGISGLLADPSFEGGGIHLTERSGFLNIHADFTEHPHRKNWRRRVNLLLYLNKNWESSYNGDLELWDRDMRHCVQKIPPLFNSVVIFNTDRDSYHGVPDPLNCPEGVTRKSIALYYFTKEEKGTFKKRSTNYRARPEDGARSYLIWLDKKLIAIYSWFKRIFGLNDNFASYILRKLGRNKK